MLHIGRDPHQMQVLLYKIMHITGLGACVVMSKLGADVVASDLEPNLPLVQDNMSGNGEYTMPSIH